MAVQGQKRASKDQRSNQRRAGLRKRARSKVGLGRRVGERRGEHPPAPDTPKQSKARRGD